MTLILTRIALIILGLALQLPIGVPALPFLWLAVGLIWLIRLGFRSRG